MTEIASTDRLARIGYLARAVVYALVGYLAVTSARSAHDGPDGAFAFIGEIPAGGIVLGLVGAGLLAYGIYKLATAILDLDRDGTGAAGIVKRIGIGAGALAYLSMCYAAVKVLVGYRASRNSGSETAGDVLALPAGEILLAVAGAGFLVAAAAQARTAWNTHFMRKLEPGAPPLTCTIGRIGLAARTVVFAIIGWSLLKGAWAGDAGEVRDLGGVLSDLRGSGTLYLLVAAGLIIFAVFSAIEARYRIVPRVDVARSARRGLAKVAA